MTAITNFGGNLRFRPRQLYAPASEAEVLAILNRHARGSVRVLGGRHAWSPGIISADALIDLKHFHRVEVLADRVRVGGGCRIHRLLETLRLRSSLAMPSLGLITEQTIAGAISTATHGSGRPSLAHQVLEVRAAAFGPDGQARIFTWNHGEMLRAARCGLGCMGVILSATLACVPRYDIEETLVPASTLEEALAGVADDPLQQLYLLPHCWTFLAHRRRAVPPGNATTGPRLLAHRLWWRLAIDLGLHALIVLNARWLKQPNLTRWFYQQIVPRCVVQRRPITDRYDRALVMEHEQFRHYEMELFVPESCIQGATKVIINILQYADGMLPAGHDLSGSVPRQIYNTYTHHYPIAYRRVLNDDAMLSMSAGSEPYYAVSFITYARDREPFLRVADCMAELLAARCGARPHWGKHMPLERATLEQLYPELPAFRAACREVDPHGCFVNDFTRRLFEK